MFSRASSAGNLSRVLATRSARTYVTDIGRTAGTVATAPTGFDKRERAQEDQFVRQHELQLLAQLRKQIDSRKAEIEELKKQEAELAESARIAATAEEKKE